MSDAGMVLLTGFGGGVAVTMLMVWIAYIAIVLANMVSGGEQ